MNSKLEEKLLQYQIANKQELLRAVEAILEAESNKSNGQDIDLIDEAVNMILTLNGVDTDELDREANILIDKILNENRVAASAEPKKSKAIRIKWLIPVAAILSLLVCATAVAYAMGYDVFSITGQTLKQLKEKIWYSGGNTSIVVSYDDRKYINYDEMIANEGFKNLLWPSQVDESNYTSGILVTDYDETVEIICEFDLQEAIVKYSAIISSSLPAIDQAPITIGDFEVYIYELENSYQADLNYMGNSYSITAPTVETLEDFIKTLEEK